MRDTEDKSWWCDHGLEQEIRFVELVTPKLGLEACINPDKETNKYAPDLIVEGILADLKCQTTPFFTARRQFRSAECPDGLDPQYAVTFNEKDYLRYKEHYPGLDIYFWVDWKETRKFNVSVRPLFGIYKVSFAQLADGIESGKAILHGYLRRVDDQQGNARSSYGFDVREFECLKQVFRDEPSRT